MTVKRWKPKWMEIIENERKITHHMQWTMIQMTQITTDISLDTMEARS